MNHESNKKLGSSCGMMACGSAEIENQKEHVSPGGTPSIKPQRKGTVIYHSGDIITMVGKTPDYVEAVVEKDGEIAFVGNLTKAKEAYPEAELYDLEGKTLVPGFIDGHGHMYFTGLVSLMANLMPPPDGPGTDFDALVKATKNYMETDTGKFVVDKTGWVFGNAYDDSQLKEKAHPDRHVLDRISTELPVIFIHQSEHLGSVNTKGLEILNITKETKDPSSGFYQRDKDGNPTGVMEEGAFFGALFPLLEKFDESMQDRAVELAQRYYASFGYTTVQDGRSTGAVTTALFRNAHNGKLYLDVYAYPDMNTNIKAMDTEYYAKGSKYKNNLRVAGGKMVLDGSPQGKTAWLTKPYFVPPPGKSDDYCGYPVLKDEQVKKIVDSAFKNKWQLITHTNGDAAIDQLLSAIDAVLKTDLGYEGHGSVVVHGQAMRKDQIPEVKRLGMTCSLFPAHTYYWGDWHRDSVFGEPRADYISPCRDVIDAGVALTTHSDSPVIPPSSFRIYDAAVNRVTRTGKILGEAQAITPYEGLLTFTRWAAEIYFEDDKKGTLEEGKLADFVILNENPLKIDPKEIHKMTTFRTIKEGQEVYKQP